VGNSNISYDPEAKTITLTQEGAEEEVFDISAFLESLYEKYQTANNTALSREDTTLELSGKNHDIKIYLDSISLENPNYTGTENQDYYDRGIYGSVLIKNK